MSSDQTIVEGCPVAPLAREMDLLQQGLARIFTNYDMGVYRNYRSESIPGTDLLSERVAKTAFAQRSALKKAAAFHETKSFEGALLQLCALYTLVQEQFSDLPASDDMEEADHLSEGYFHSLVGFLMNAGNLSGNLYASQTFPVETNPFAAKRALLTNFAKD